MGYTGVAAGGRSNCENVVPLAEKLQGMIGGAENNQAAHPNFIADLYRWLEELEAELAPSAETQWGTY